MTHKHNHKGKPKPALPAVEKPEEVQPFSVLLASGVPGKALDSWNGMKVFVMEPKTGNVLVNAGADISHDPASLTKLAFFDVLMDAVHSKKINPDDTIVVPKYARNVQATKVRVGDRMKVSDLISALMLKSDNGAAHILYRHAQQALGVDPIDLMNQNMGAYGLKHSHYINVSGLPSNQDNGFSQNGEKTTTARDAAHLLQRVQQNYPADVKRYMTPPSVTYGGKTHGLNHFLYTKELRLPKDYEAGAKTGYTDRAGYNIASLITAPDSRQLIVVVLGGNWSHRDVAAEAGVPAPMLLERSVKGNQVRDALVGDLVKVFLARYPQDLVVPTAVEIAELSFIVAPREAEPALADTGANRAGEVEAPRVNPDRETASSPAVTPEPDLSQIVRGLPPAAQEALAECKKALVVGTHPEAESSTKTESSKTPNEVIEGLKKLKEAPTPEAVNDKDPCDIPRPMPKLPSPPTTERRVGG